MKKATELLTKLHCYRYTERHIKLIDKFVNSGETDCKALLNQLGSWDEKDLEITERWLNSEPQK